MSTPTVSEVVHTSKEKRLAVDSSDLEAEHG